MTKREARQIGHGLFKLFWKSGGASLAAVGSDREGNRWFAPTNWIVVPSFKWAMVKSFMKLL